MTSTLSRGAQIAAAGAAVLLVDMFLSWYGIDVGEQIANLAGVDTTANAWQAFDFIDILLFLTVLATGAWIGASLTGNELAGQLRLGVLAGGGLCALLVLYRILNQPGPNDLVTVKFGVFIGLLACVAIAYGAATSGDDAAPGEGPPSA